MNFEEKIAGDAAQEPLSEEMRASLLEDIENFKREELEGKRKSIHLTDVQAEKLSEEDLRQYAHFKKCLEDEEHSNSAELMEDFKKYRKHIPKENKNSQEFAAFIGNRWIAVQLAEY